MAVTLDIRFSLNIEEIITRGKACLLLFRLAQKHDMKYLYITCNPDNYASRKTCEYAGGKLMDIVELPEGNDMRDRGESEKCIYEFILNQ